MEPDKGVNEGKLKQAIALNSGLVHPNPDGGITVMPRDLSEVNAIRLSPDEHRVYIQACLLTPEDKLHRLNEVLQHKKVDGLDERKAYIEKLENMLFERGAMEDAPCFVCGYNGPGYFHPDRHPCAEKHFKLRSLKK